ncbi:hypothetical protein K523DRAFT_376584 [Schizophyllum commune Tattone D]|nr:hypothetical protein K523DRAFT_376584 [Schizophyllum commune Tattone D]
MPTHGGDELTRMWKMFANIADGSPSALPRHAALAKLKASLARGRLFRGFDKGPPQRQYGQPPMKLDPLVTATARTSLRHYGLLCSEIDDLELSPYPSPLWQSLYAAVPMAMEWVAFLHPMNGNIRKVDDPDYYLDVAHGFLVLLDGMIQPRVGADEDALADWLVTTRLDVYIVDFWVNLRRYMSDPPKILATRLLHWMHTLCLALPRPHDTLIPERIGDNLTNISQCGPRRMHRTVMWYAKVISEGADDEDMLEKLYSLASSSLGEVYTTPYSPPNDVVTALLRDIERNIEWEAWSVVESACSYLERIWTYATSYRVHEVSIAHGAFDVFVRLGKAFPRDPAIEKAIRATLFTLSRSFIYWRPLAALHLKHGPVLVEIDEDLQLPTLAFGFGSFVLGEAAREKEALPSVLHGQGWSNARDKEFMGNICMSHLRSHAEAIAADLKELDPDRQHHCVLYVFLSQRRLLHVVEPAAECRPGEPRIGAIVGVWEEELKGMVVHVGAMSIGELEMIDVQERPGEMPRAEPFDISAHAEAGAGYSASMIVNHIQGSSEVAEEQYRAREIAQQSIARMGSLFGRH